MTKKLQQQQADSCNTSWKIISSNLMEEYTDRSSEQPWEPKWRHPLQTSLWIDLENRFLQTQRILPLIWRRYIDDIFMIWTHGRDSLETFLRELNTFHHSIKFTFDISNTEAVFLDVTVHKGERFKATPILDCRTHLRLQIPSSMYTGAHAIHLE